MLRSFWLKLLSPHEWALLLALVAVVLVAGAVDPQHNYFQNPQDSIKDISRQAAMLGIFALGAAVVIIAGGIDLSSGSMIAFSATICASVIKVLAPESVASGEFMGYGVATAAVAAALASGFLVGSLHAWLITVVRLPPFVATLATLVGLRSLARAICQHVGGGAQIHIFNGTFRYITTNVWIPVLLFALLALGIWLMLSRTVVGRHLYALGGNEEAARLCGLRTDRLKWLAYCISAMLASLAGVLYMSDQGAAVPQTMGLGYELNAIAAAVVGGCSLQGGIGTAAGTVLGVLFLRTVIDAVSKVIKVEADIYQGLIVGGAVVIAVAFTQLGHRAGRFFQGGLGLVAALNLSLLTFLLTMLFVPRIATDLAPRANTIAAAAGGAVALLLLSLHLTARRKRR